MVHIKEEECEDLETRCTAIIYTIAEDVERCRRLQEDYNSIKALASLSAEIPAYLKALSMEEPIQMKSYGSGLASVTT